MNDAKERVRVLRQVLYFGDLFTVTVGLKAMVIKRPDSLFVCGG